MQVTPSQSSSFDLPHVRSLCNAGKLPASDFRQAANDTCRLYVASAASLSSRRAEHAFRDDAA